MSFSLAVTDRELYVSIGSDTLTGTVARHESTAIMRRTAILYVGLAGAAAGLFFVIRAIGERIQAPAGVAAMPLGGEAGPSALFRALLVLTVIIITARLVARSSARSASRR